MQGDLQEAIRNPRRAIQYLSELRWRAKLYTHFKEIFADQTYKWLYDRIKPDTTLLDIGAFVGDSAIYFSMNPNVTRVVAYEPMPWVYNYGKSLIREKEKIDYKNMAIGKEGTLHLPYMRTSGIAAASRMKKGKVEVPSIGLKEAIANHKRIAIKCDVEGDEYNIFMDLPKSIFKNVYAIQMEVHKHIMDSSSVSNAGATDALLNHIRQCGFKVRCLEKGDKVSTYGFSR